MPKWPLRWPFWHTGAHSQGQAQVSEGRFIALSDRGRRRATNQDRALARELPGGALLLLVADGVGGAGGGEVASAETVNAVVAALGESDRSDIPSSLLRAVARANERVRELGKIDPELKGMATTLVAAVVSNADAWIVSLGDSRAYVCRGGQLEPLTEDDSWVAEQVRAGLLTPEDAAKSPYQNVITRGIGVEEGVRLEAATHFALQPGDILFLCSDGLYRCVTPETIAETLVAGTVAEAAEKLIELANKAGGPDNISVAIYRHG
jgi:protein phosphatase